MRSTCRQLLILCAALVVSGCGFALRGAVDLPPALQTLQLESTDGNSDIVRDMRRALEVSDITVVSQARPGIYRLGIGNERVVERVLSVNSNARAGEYELSLSVPFQLRNGETFLIGPETLSIEKVYLADPNSAVAKAEERELIEEEMRRELVNQIMRRLQALSL